MELSIVVATYNRSRRVVRLLESLLEQDCDAGVWECVVVNNNSTDDTAEVLDGFVKAHPDFDIKVVEERRQGLSHARNCGVGQAVGEVVVMVDDDEFLVPQFVSAYRDFFRDRSVMSAGGRIVPEYDGGRPRWMNMFCESAIASPIDLGDVVREFPRGVIPGGGNMAFRRSIFARYGLFDTTLGRSGAQLLGGEESNLFARLRGGGENIWYVPDAVTHHIVAKERLERSYLDRLWFGVGASQLVRAKVENPRIGAMKALFAEGVKWFVTLFLMCYLFATFRPMKGRYILLMRSRITLGMLSKLFRE